MSLKRGYLIDPIEKFLDLLGLLAAGKKPTQDEDSVEQVLASLTGLPVDFFEKVVDQTILFSVLTMVPTDDQKAIAALILWHKDNNAYRETARLLISPLDKKKLDGRVSELIVKAGL